MFGGRTIQFCLQNRKKGKRVPSLSTGRGKGCSPGIVEDEEKQNTGGEKVMEGDNYDSRKKRPDERSIERRIGGERENPGTHGATAPGHGSASQERGRWKAKGGRGPGLKKCHNQKEKKTAISRGKVKKMKKLYRSVSKNVSFIAS